MQKSMIAVSLLSALIGGSISHWLSREPTVLAAREHGAESITMLDTIQARRIILVDEHFRTVMSFDSGRGSPTLTIQSPQGVDTIMIQPSGLTARSDIAQGGNKKARREAVFRSGDATFLGQTQAGSTTVQFAFDPPSFRRLTSNNNNEASSHVIVKKRFPRPKTTRRAGDAKPGASPK